MRGEWPGHRTCCLGKLMAPEPPRALASSDTVPQHRNERRTARRIPVEVEVALAGSSQLYSGVTADLSRGGLFVRTPRVCAPGHRLLVSFALPTGDIRGPGIVRWARRAAPGKSPGLGIAFEGLSDVDQENIEWFCLGIEAFDGTVT